MPLWLDRAGKTDGLSGASLVEIFVIKHGISVTCADPGILVLSLF